MLIRLVHKWYIRKWQKHYAMLDKKGDYVKRLTKLFRNEEAAREFADLNPPVMISWELGLEFPMWEPVKKAKDSLESDHNQCKASETKKTS